MTICLFFFFNTLEGNNFFFGHWAGLFTAEYPVHWYTFLRENIHWEYRVKFYLSNMSDEY